MSLTLLLTVPTPVFVGTATLAAWLITCTGVVDRVLTGVNGPVRLGYRGRERLVARASLRLATSTGAMPGEVRGRLRARCDHRRVCRRA